MMNGELIIKDKSDPTKIPDALIKAYAAKYKVRPIEAFSDLLSQDLLDRIENMPDQSLKLILKILIENVVGKGAKK